MAEPPAIAEPEVWEGEGRAAQPQLTYATPRLSVEGFEGPLDFLLEMVLRQRVDLGRLSILGLTDQLVAAIESGEDGSRWSGAGTGWSWRFCQFSRQGCLVWRGGDGVDRLLTR